MFIPSARCNPDRLRMSLVQRVDQGVCTEGAHYRLLKFPEVEALCCLNSATNHVICNVFQDLTGWMRWKYLDSTFSLLYMLHRTTLSVFNAA